MGSILEPLAARFFGMGPQYGRLPSRNGSEVWPKRVGFQRLVNLFGSPDN